MRNTTKRASKRLAPRALQDPISGARLLANGRYAVLVNSNGAGFSWADRHLLSKWDQDPVFDRDGFFLWVRDAESGEVAGTTLKAGRVYTTA